MRHLGIDYGTKRIGIALSDGTGCIASPHATLTPGSRRKAVAAVAALVQAERIEAVVVGMPLSLDGSKGPSARRCERFADELAVAIEAPVHVWDERFTTSSAQHAMREGGLSAPRRKEAVDRVAAALILQSYLDAHPA